jgi:general secretion pathway protein A
VTTTYEHLFASFGLQQNPFGASPDSRFFFSTPAHESALAELLFAIQTRQGLMLLTGESGAGKTTLLQQLLDTLRQRRISSSYIFHSRLDVDYLFRFILQDFGVACDSRRKGEILEILDDWLVERHAAGDSPVIIIDEAQALPTDTIDELRLLLNLESSHGKLVQIVLSGQPELNEKLRKPELRQLRQRVMFRSKLPLLTCQETSAYIQSRLAMAGLSRPDFFLPEAVDAIFQYSRGIPRTINLLGEHAIINAYAEQKRSITPDAIRYIAADFDLVENPLSVKQDGGEERQRVVHFPAPSTQPGSLSALRLAFLREGPLEQPAPAASVAPRSSSFAIEQVLALADTPLPSKASAPLAQENLAAMPTLAVVATPPATPEQVEVPGALSAKDPAPAKSDGPARQPAAATILAEIFPPPPTAARNGAFVRYWKGVAGSFRRDVRAFQRDCGHVFRSPRRGKPSPTQKESHLSV